MHVTEVDQENPLEPFKVKLFTIDDCNPASMASINPFSGLNSGDKPWVEQISKTLKTQLAVTIDTPPVSIFEVPKTTKSEKLEAYVPQRVGLGPNHHFQPELYRMEQNKLTAVKKVLRLNQIQDFQQVVEKVKEIVPIICACYDSYLDTDEDTLAWLFIIDGLFLLDQLDAYSDRRFGFEARDLIMLENQIPLIVLKEIEKAIWGKNVVADHDQEDYIESKFQSFCESHSPFLVSKEKMINPRRFNHLLDYIYHSIVSDDTSIGDNFTHTESHSSKKDAKLELVEAIVNLAKLVPGAKPFLQIVELAKQNFPATEKETMVEEIKVPSVSEFRDIANIKFLLSPRNQSIRNINFVLKKERSCYLPRIILNIDSEVILRNLVAYEKLMVKNGFTEGFSLELTEYVDFMCGIIDTVKDVRLLREEKIIEGEMGDEEIVKLFNGISRCHGKMRVESEIMKTVAELNKVYESVPRVWVQRMAEKELRASAKLINWVIGVLSVLISVREVYIRVYGSNPPHVMWVEFLRTKLGHFLH